MNKTQKLYPFKFEAECSTLDENSIITNGFLSENSIDDVIDTYLGEIAGNDNFQYYKGILPIKISFKSIGPDGLAPQLHPDSLTAMERYMSIGKAKLWYITKSTPQTVIYLGFNKQMDATTLYNSCLNGSILDNLHRFTPKAGDYIYIKPGCIHAVVGELEFIEISQNSEITYHLTGEDAAMEIAEAIDVVDYTPSDEKNWLVSDIVDNTTIANTSAFIVKYINLENPVDKKSDESLIVYLCLNGKAHIETNGSVYELNKGEMILVPAGMENFTLANDCKNTGILEIYLPKVSDLDEDLYMNYYEDESNDECECDDDECDCGHHHCGDDCHCEEEHHEHHHHEHHNCSCGCSAHNNNGANIGLDNIDPDNTEERHPGEFFFKR